MRLGQLARKLTIRPVDILEFLSGKEIQLESDSNTRLSDELVVLITNHFSPEKESKIIKDEVIQEATTDFVQQQEVVELTIEETLLAVELPAADDALTIIKAPKVELSGLKIVGKIDLPEPKKKDIPKEELGTPEKDASIENPVKEKPDEKSSFQRRNQRTENTTPRKNPIALQREREMLEAEIIKQERVIQQKEQRTNNYLKKVRTAAPTKSAKLIAEPMEEFSKAEEPPKTLLAKFFRWLKR